MIYFAQSVDGGPVKIGYSHDVDARIKQLETHYGRPLALLATMPGDVDTEREIHERFDHLRYPGPRRRGPRIEQFQPAPELMEFIGRPLFVSANPDTVEAMRSQTVLVIRATPEWEAWLDDARRALSREVGFSVSRLMFLDVAMARLAKGLSLPDPPRRTEGR